MAKSLNFWTRKLHRWGAVITFVPLLIVIVSGLFLQVKKQFVWIQPVTAKGSGDEPTIAFNEILDSAKSVSEAGFQSWDDIDRLDVRPSKGVIKIRGKNRWEIQVDASSGEVLAANYRRSDLIESLHDGSWFSEPAKLWVFLPNAIILCGLWLTGLYLWLLPFLAKRKRRHAKTT